MRAIPLFLLSFPLLSSSFQDSIWRSDPFKRDGAELDRITLADDGTISLASDWTKWLPPVAPSKQSVVTALNVFQGRLISTSCYDLDGKAVAPSPNPCDFGECSPESGDWKIVHTQAPSLVVATRVIGERLLAAEFETIAMNRLTIFDGREWSDSCTLPKEMIHAMDLCEWKGKMYLAGSVTPRNPDKILNNPDFIKGYGAVYESGDQGKTWSELYETEQVGRILWLTPWRDRLWANSRGFELLSWDGSTWTPHPIKLDGVRASPLLGAGPLVAAGDALCAVNPELAYRFDGARWESITPGFVLCDSIGGTLFGVRDDGNVCSSTDGRTWTKVAGDAIPKREFERKVDGGRPLRRGSIAIWRGRLVVGTGATGLIYMTPFQAKGTFTLPPANVSVPSSGTLAADAVVPDGTSLELQLRSAKSREGLMAASWRSPTAKGIITFSKGDAWIQVRLQMESGAGHRRSPIVKSVSLR